MIESDWKEKRLRNVTKIPNNIEGITGRSFLVPGITV